MKASEAYAQKYLEVRDLMADITKALDQHGPSNEEIDRDWGYVGDLGYVAEQLKNVRQFLNGEEAD